MYRKYPRVCFLLVMFLITVSQSTAIAEAAQPAICEVTISSVQDLGAVKTPATVVARDGGATNLIGNQILWVFGDTLFNTASSDGVHLRSNTAALGSLTDPLNVSEPVDANGVPYPLLGFTSEEQAYNDTHAVPNERIALWPVSIVPEGDRTGLLFYLKLIAKPGVLNYTFIGTGLAEIDQGKTTAVRDPDLLFTAPEPLFASAFIDGATLYLYGMLMNGKKDQSFGIGRVLLNSVRDRGAYQFWNGAAWVSDVTQTAPILNNIPGDVSVAYNRYLKHYLAIHSEILSNRVVMQLAEQPQGPWSDPLVIFVGQPAVNSVDYAGRQHAELASMDDRTIFVSYYHPLGLFTGELRLVELVLGCMSH